MYQLALPYFPDNEKLKRKMHILQEKLRVKREQQQQIVEISQDQGQILPQLPAIATHIVPAQEQSKKKRSRTFKELEDPTDDEYRLEDDATSDRSFEDHGASFRFKQKSRRAPRPKIRVFRDIDEDVNPVVKQTSPVARARAVSVGEQTPRTRHILSIINTRDLPQIRLLKGVGAKKAETIVDCLRLLENEHQSDNGMLISSLAELSRMKGVGAKTVENMRGGIIV
jgi:DNA uptake protein ComE-like DNA-binding protein